MKKVGFLMIFIAVIAAITMCANAVQSDTVKQNESIEIIFENEASLPEEYKHRLCDIVMNYHLTGVLSDGQGANNTKGIMCSVFGHKEITQRVNAIEHKVLATVPRCKETTYEVTTCERCEYEEITTIGVRYINCCPEE